MKRTSILVGLLLVALNVRADVRLFLWQEARDEKNGEKLSAFYLAPTVVMTWMEAMARGDSKLAESIEKKLPKDAWMYGLALHGEGQAFTKIKLSLFEPKPCGSLIQIESGSVELDRKTGTVRVALKVRQDGRLIDFIGNGDFPIRRDPAETREPSAKKEQ